MEQSEIPKINRRIQRISFTGKLPMDILQMHLIKNGFELSFTQPLDSTMITPAHFHFRHYYYDYHLKYGSDQYDVKDITPASVEISSDRKKVKINLDIIKPGYIYELTLTDIMAATGTKLENKIICYTVNKLNDLD